MKPALALISSDGELSPDAPTYAELLDRLASAEDTNAGQEATIKLQASKIGRLERQLAEETDPNRHPQSKEITALIDRWRVGTQHPKAKHSRDRLEIIKARLKDGYSLEQLELAIDGIACFAFVVNGQRVREGKPSNRHDSLSLALKGGENTERFANLGALARKNGWVTWGTDVD